MPGTTSILVNKQPTKVRQAIFTVSLCSALLLLGNGCRTNMAVNFGNGTPSKIWVRSSQSAKEIEVSPEHFKKLPHGSGDLIVRTASNERFRFADISAFHVDVKYRDAHSSIFGFSSVVLSVRLGTNMELYALMPGTKTVDQNVAQPKGYPKVGQKLNE